MIKIGDQNWEFLRVIRSFFPLHLLITHLRYNLISLLIWSFFYLIIFGKMGSSFGIQYLFLSPEYLGSVSPISFLLLGFAFGGFLMGFNSYSYLKVGSHYPFLTTLARPFLKFCLNNSIIPLAFFITHVLLIWNFQREQEYTDVANSILFIAAYLSGIIIFILLSVLYFFPMSKRNKTYEEHAKNPFQSFILRRSNWYSVFKKEKSRQLIYIGKNLRFMVSRSTDHFDQELYERIFAKNRINASLYEVLTIIIFFLLGLFNEYTLFEVPAAASIVLLFTIILMLFSALQAWMREWTYPALIFIILIMNGLSVHTGLFNYTSYAYGLDYNKKSSYTIDEIRKLHTPQILSESQASMIETLNNWKKRSGKEKPKLVIINTSGGGSRSALWTIAVLQHLNTLTDGSSTAQTQMITGASGGMIGAAYYRSILLASKLDTTNRINVSDSLYLNNMGKDILNKLSFMASTNDILIRYQKAEYNGHRYTIDRGYGFELQLNRNTDFILDKRLSYFAKYEKSGTIPTMIFSPTIVNDGRRMLIGSQNLSFLTKDPSFLEENIDFQTFFGEQAAKDIRFSSVLRASATFPFVMPMITLPTEPEVLLMDAGIRDNYGTKNTLLYLEKLKDWIKENTSGVIVVQIRDTRKLMKNEQIDNVSFLSKLSLPFGNMYKNFPRVQSFDQEEMIRYAKHGLPFDVKVATLNLMERRDEKISLSWHLTKKEKVKIYEALRTKENAATISELIALLK